MSGNDESSKAEGGHVGNELAKLAGNDTPIYLVVNGLLSQHILANKQDLFNFLINFNQHYLVSLLESASMLYAYLDISIDNILYSLTLHCTKGIFILYDLVCIFNLP